MGGLVSSVSDAITGGSDSAMKPLKDFKPTPFRTAGLSGSTQDGTFQLTRSGQLTNALSGVQGSLTGRAQGFRDLIPQTASGFGALTEAGVNRLQDKRRRAVGNLRENLARRRVSGSSFGSDALARAEAEFAREEEDFRAQTGLQEIDTTMRLIDAATQADTQAAQTTLKQLNFESELGAKLSSDISQLMSRNAEMQSQVATEFAGARANIVGSLTGAATTGYIAGL